MTGKRSQLERKENRSSEEQQILDGLKHSFPLVISADYQMNKLLSHWGESPQPGSTYYLQKVSYDIFGVIDHRDATGHCYLFSECIGPKNTDHTVSYIFHYLRSTNNVPGWVKRVYLFLDNAILNGEYV